MHSKVERVCQEQSTGGMRGLPSYFIIPRWPSGASGTAEVHVYQLATTLAGPPRALQS